jgi:hypothetical protein
LWDIGILTALARLVQTKQSSPTQKIGRGIRRLQAHLGIESSSIADSEETFYRRETNIKQWISTTQTNETFYKRETNISQWISITRAVITEEEEEEYGKDDKPENTAVFGIDQVQPLFRNQKSFSIADPFDTVNRQ